jgi:L-alanine-DL-glutamate epimerase-like enolase superfamily enzyme
LRVKNIKVSVHQVPLSEELAMPFGSFNRLDHVIVTLNTTDGTFGQGEATVIPEFMGESLLQVVGESRVLARSLAGADPEDMDSVHSTIDRLLPSCRSARAAIDEACHDVTGKKHGSPVWRLLGQRQREHLTCTWAIGLKDPQETVDEAVFRQSKGYSTFKIKIGESDEEDLIKIRRLREALGSEALIRLDANGVYSPQRALRTLDRMVPYGLEMVEQPCAATELGAMAELRRSLGIKILADESVFCAADAEKLIEAGAADLVNIKIQKLGGLRPATYVASIVEKAGLACIVGSCLEVGPGIAASAHFAVTCRSAAGASDLTAGLQHSDGLAAAWFGGLGPTIREPVGSGLGVSRC